MKLKNTLEEAKFAVEVEDIGTVIVDGSSEGEVKARVAKKLKGGKEMIKSIRKIFFSIHTFIIWHVSI